LSADWEENEVADDNDGDKVIGEYQADKLDEADMSVRRKREVVKT